MKNNKITTLLSPILFFVLGIILFTNPDTVVKFISYILGGILILVGLYKCVNYYIHDKKLQVVNRNEMAFGITAIILGLLFIFLANAIEFLIRVCFGVYMLFIGINKMLQTVYTTDRSTKFYSLIVVGLIFIAGGMYTILDANLALQIIGLFMIIYGILDFISYFLNRSKEEVKEEIEEVQKIITNDDVLEAEVVEEKEETKPKRKSKK